MPAIAWPAVTATELPADLQLTSIDGQTRGIDEWLITFQLLGVVLDPFTYESSWLLDTAGRILDTFRDASVRTCLITTCTASQAREFAGPWVERVLIYADPDRLAVKALELDELPALVHIRQSRQVAAVAQGWQPPQWRAITTAVAKERNWTHPVFPAPGDPAPYAGTPALGQASPTQP